MNKVQRLRKIGDFFLDRPAREAGLGRKNRATFFCTQGVASENILSDRLIFFLIFFVGARVRITHFIHRSDPW